MIDSEVKPIPAPRERSSWNVAFVVLIVTVFSFGLVAQLIGMAIAFATYDGSMLQFAEDLQNPVGKEGMKTALWIAQGITTVLGLAVLPPLFWWAMRRRSLMTFVNETPVKPIHLLYTLGIVIFFMGVNSLVIEWNSNLSYPGEFGVWARTIEDKAAELTKFLTSFESFGEYFVAVLVIAVFAAIGEELVFRGLLQTELEKSFKNAHAAIWVSAIFFSALHLQFYGFFPRVLLGAVFGYLFYWSGNLIVPIFAHFVNNFFLVSAIYFGMEELEEPTAAPWYYVLPSAAIFGFLFYRFYATRQKSQLSSE